MILPEWAKFEAIAKNSFPQVRITKIQCEDGNEAICKQKGINGYPTIILYRQNDSEIKFEEERTAEKLIQFIQRHVR